MSKGAENKVRSSPKNESREAEAREIEEKASARTEDEDDLDETDPHDEPEAEDESDSDDDVAPPKRETRAEPLRFSATTLVAVAVLVGAGAFAAGRSTSGSASTPSALAESPPKSPMDPSGGQAGGQGGGGGGGGGGGTRPGETLPPGHPQVADPPSGGGMAAMPGMPGTPRTGDVAPAAIDWKVPARWKLVPNASPMRIATYSVPRAGGDSKDAEITVTQAGGSVEDNAKRWIGQFGAEGAKSAKRSTRKVKGIDIAIVEVEGPFAGGMGSDGQEAAWAMLGAIVQTEGMPHFFKLTGPVKSVKAARAEFDELLGSVTLK